MAEANRKVTISLMLEDKMSKALKTATSKTKDLYERVKTTNVSFKAMGVAVGAAAAAVTGAAVAAFKFTENIAAAADEMFFMSQKTGVTVEEISQFKFIAEQSGAEAVKFQDALKTVSEKAVMGDANLEKLGLSVKDVNGNMKSAKQLFMESADIIAKQGSSAEKAGAANILLGGAGLDLIPMLELGSAGMQELADKADNLGITMSSAGAALGNEFNNQLGSVQGMLDGVARTVGEAMMPAFIRAFNVMQDELKVFAPIAEAVFNGMKFGAGIAVKAVSILAQTFIAVGATIKNAFHTVLIGFNEDLSGIVKVINAAIRGMNMLLPETAKVDEIYNAFEDTMRENEKAIRDTSNAAGEQIVAIQRLENALLSTEPMVIKTATAQSSVAKQTRETTKSLQDLSAVEEARAKRKAGAEAQVEDFRAQQAEYRLQMQIKMTNELAAAEEAAAEKRAREAAEMETALTSAADTSMSAFMTAFDAAEEGQSKVAEGMKAMGASIIDTALDVMQKQVTASAASAAAKAAESQAAIPVIGPALAAAAAAAMFGLVRGFVSLGFKNMKDGGMVTGGTPGKDSVPIMAMPGEYVLTTDQVRQLQQGGQFGFAPSGQMGQGGGGNQITIEMNSQIPAGRAEIKRFVRQNVVPALKELRTQGMF